ncbi:unnamed protein product [Didymodactylos carnosus]|uniref:Uncharacterized protein n=1 Tax=Didymodactylos carnosus TaxID=1234261 RepID=A0A8S2X5T0_9BILA|nr:unnamed protein product [Didymodactylos carnosus]CAF4480069.1 unnamed protein product [Didymodactylos carnosus]
MTGEVMAIVGVQKEPVLSLEKKTAIYKKYYFNARILSLNPPQSDKDDEFRKNVYVDLYNELNAVVHFIGKYTLNWP